MVVAPLRILVVRAMVIAMKTISVTETSCAETPTVRGEKVQIAACRDTQVSNVRKKEM